MFDIGFSELMLIGIVALVVIGPERLPKVARTAGLLLGRLQRYVNDVKADINREMQLDELKALRSELQESARDFEQRVSSELQSVEQAVVQTAPIASEAPPPAATAAATPLAASGTASAVTPPAVAPQPDPRADSASPVGRA